MLRAGPRRNELPGLRFDEIAAHSFELGFLELYFGVALFRGFVGKIWENVDVAVALLLALVATRVFVVVLVDRIVDAT